MGDTVITGIKRSAPALIIIASLFAACGGGGGGGGGSSRGTGPIVTPTTTPSPTPTTSGTAAPLASLFVCPTTGTAGTASVVRHSTELGRRMARGRHATVAPEFTRLAITYPKSTATANASLIASKEILAGARFLRSVDSTSNTTTRVVSVPTKTLAQSEATFRTMPGVTNVSVTDSARHTMAVTTPYWTNDPYFNGFSATDNSTAGNPGPSTFHTALSENATTPGEWNMHVIGLEKAFGYSQPGNGSAFVSAFALGSNTVKIAIIDTGEDASHPELTSKIAHQQCYVSNDAGTVQTSGNFSTDGDGHGTDVSGLAAAASNNAFGFVGSGGKAVIYAYRVFPTPDDTCVENSNNSDDSCNAQTQDIASAIDDAVAKGVNIISMSLGGDVGGLGCKADGSDEDPIEGAAVAKAIAANIIVVAAAGNSGPSSNLEAPACDPGVIAVGATGLDDGVATGTTGAYTSTLVGNASAATPIEYVASYSQTGPVGGVHSASAWGIVAPGGDPAANEGNANATVDDLHWIENIWTSTPADKNFAAGPVTVGDPNGCDADYPNQTTGSVNDCRTLIAGTSMATPTVAGAAALILAVDTTGAYHSPAAMKTLLCTTADDISDSRQGCGRLNVYKAMAMVLGDTP